MSLRFSCPKCRQSFEGVDAYRGRVVSCPSCQQPIQVPADAPVVAAVKSAPATPILTPLATATPILTPLEPLAPILTPLTPVAAATIKAPSGPFSPQVAARNQQQFAQQLMPLLQNLFRPGPLAAVRGQNLSPGHVQAAMQFVCPSADPNSLLLVLGDCNDELRAGFVVTPTHAYSRYRREMQAIPLDDVASAAMPDKYIVNVETASGDKIETGVSLGDLRPAIMTFFQQVGILNQQFPRRQPDRWQGKPFPIDSLLLQHWDPGQDLIFRCDVGIPRKRLAGAIQTYGQGVSEHEVLGLFDNTMLAGGQAGFFFTRDKLFYSDQLGLSAGSAYYWRIRSAEADATHEGTTGKVSVNLDSGKQLLLSHTSVTPLGPLFRATFQSIAAVSNQFAARR